MTDNISEKSSMSEKHGRRSTFLMPSISAFKDSYSVLSEAYSAAVLKLTESYVWAGLVLLPAILSPKVDKFQPSSVLKFYQENSLWTVYSIILAFIPISVLIVFGELPFTAIGRNLIARRVAETAVRRLPEARADDITRRLHLFGLLSTQSISAIEASQNLDPRELLSLYAQKSEAVANRIFFRSNIYIIVGVLIALSGLAFFYTSASVINPDLQLSAVLASVVPHLSILFFIELVAFFFLRQHRVAMDEYRHFEQIKRSREENLIILKMFSENSTISPTKDVLQAMNFYSNPTPLSKDATTEFLEARKLIKDESGIFERIVDLAAAIKQKSDPKESK